jgi:hypothetical protein
MDLWMITRVNGEEWVVLDVVDDFYGVHPMDEQKWSDSFGYRMVLGLAPKVAPRVKEIPAYASAPASQMAHIESYIGVPLEFESGKLFGLISGISHTPKNDDLCNALPEVTMYSKGLMHMLHSERQIASLESQIVHMSSNTFEDAETGILNFEAWLFDCVDADWARVNHLEPAGIAYMDFGNLPLEKHKTAIKEVINISEGTGRIYRDLNQHYFVLFRNLSKHEQQLKVQKIRKLLASMAQDTHCSFFYRHPKSMTSSILDEVKRHATYISRTVKAA